MTPSKPEFLPPARERVECHAAEAGVTLKADRYPNPDGPAEAARQAFEAAAPQMERQMKEAIETAESGPRKKFCYVGAPEIFKLELACHDLVQAFDSYGVYLVGSALQRPDWRDVDLRLGIGRAHV